MLQGGDTVLRTVEAIVKGEAASVAQSQMYACEEELRPAPKIFRDTCRIDWSRSVQQIYDFIRGLSPYPAAWCELSDATGSRLALKVYSAGKEYAAHNITPGTLLSDGKSFMKVAVDGGYVVFNEVQLAGKKRMPVVDLLRGFSVEGMNICND